MMTMLLISSLSLFWSKYMVHSLMFNSLLCLILMIWIFIIMKIIYSHIQILFTLLLLESLMLTTLMILMMVMGLKSSNLMFFFTFFVCAVCEASIGLSLLIQVSREKNNLLFLNL